MKQSIWLFLVAIIVVSCAKVTPTETNAYIFTPTQTSTITRTPTITPIPLSSGNFIYANINCWYDSGTGSTAYSVWCYKGNPIYPPRITTSNVFDKQSFSNDAYTSNWTDYTYGESVSVTITSTEGTSLGNQTMPLYQPIIQAPQNGIELAPNEDLVISWIYTGIGPDQPEEVSIYVHQTWGGQELYYYLPGYLKTLRIPYSELPAGECNVYVRVTNYGTLQNANPGSFFNTTYGHGIQFVVN